jgi:hypothetical protein
MKSYTLRPDTFTLNFNVLFQVRDVLHSIGRTGIIDIIAGGHISSLLNSNQGIGKGRIGAVYREGGHSVKVSFNERTGDIPEMECNPNGGYIPVSVCVTVCVCICVCACVCGSVVCVCGFAVMSLVRLNQ